MEWREVEDATLAAALSDGRLKPPTNSAFNAEAWVEEARCLPLVGRRDAALAMAALLYGQRLQAVRRDLAMAPIGPTQAVAIRLLAACANHQSLAILDKALGGLGAAIQDQDEPHFEQVNQRLLSGAMGQTYTASDLNTSLVDALPHWLHRIVQLPLISSVPKNDDPTAGAVAALAGASIENGVRGLWLSVLWLGHEIERHGETYLDTPSNRTLAEHWLMWDLRQTALAMAETHMDVGAAMVAGGQLVPIVPVATRTVVAIKRGPGGRRRFIVGPASTTSPEQRVHASERDTLERLYTGQFLDEPLPRPASLDLTCRELNAAWIVLADMARLVVRQLGREIRTDRDVGRFAIPAEIDDLSALLEDALGIAPERARAILDLLTCDPADTGSLFSQGVWATPFLAEPGTARRYLLLAPLLFGSAVRRIEAFMIRGGISDSGGVKGRGKPFESRVRRVLFEAMCDNPLLTDHAVHLNALARKGRGEEIDLLVRIGSTVLVGEVKCFVAPSEPLERHNYLRSLAAATRQAKSKVEWAQKNRMAVAALLGVAEPDALSRLRFLPVVVLNQGFGMGLLRFGVPVVDLAYLKLLLGNEQYQGRTRYERDVGMSYDMVQLYDSQADLEARLAERLENPVVLKRYAGAIGWREVPFAWDDIHIAMPTLTGRPDG